MQDLNVKILQVDIDWENIEDNCKRYEAFFNHDDTNLYVLPEMFSTGFTMKPSPIAEDMENSFSLNWMQNQAKKYNTAVCGSLAIKDTGRYYNRFLFVHPDGTYESYDKRHLFSMAGEHISYTPGNKQLIIDYKGWKISPYVCYDLRFPVWSKLNGKADIIIYVANWPEPRRNAWKSLLLARAIENQAYVLACNRVGNDKNDFTFVGGSAIIDPYGEYIAQDTQHKEQVLTSMLKYESLQAFREKFPVHRDADRFTIDS